MNVSALNVLTLSIVSSLLLSSCASEPTVIVKTQYIVNTPAKISAPPAPKFAELDTNASLNSTRNVKRLMNNLSLLKNYTLSLQDTVQYYENEIDRLNAEGVKLNEQSSQ